MGEDIRGALEAAGIPFHDEADLNAVLPYVDVVYQTRIQKERFQSAEEYESAKGTYIVSASSMAKLRSDSILLHPLPRVDEIATEVDSDPRAAYFRQARNGVFIRMALLDMVMGGS
jgi:aspartate carbamoyltransferase catalytic subunit